MTKYKSSAGISCLHYRVKGSRLLGQVPLENVEERRRAGDFHVK